MKDPLNQGGMSRRLFLNVSALGAVTVTALGSGLLPAQAKPYQSKFTWISPRGTIEVMDDYAIWVAKAMGISTSLA